MQTKCIVMMSKERSTKIVNCKFFDPQGRNLVQGSSHLLYIDVVDDGIESESPKTGSVGCIPQPETVTDRGPAKTPSAA